MLLTQFVSPDLFVSVRGGFLTLSIWEGSQIVTLNCRDIHSFAKSVSANIKQSNFQVNLGGAALLRSDSSGSSKSSSSSLQIVYSSQQETLPKKELLISAKEFKSLLQVLVDCVPFMLLSGAEQLEYVVAVKSLVNHLTEKVDLEQGENCFRSLKRGRGDEVLLKFVTLLDLAQNKKDKLLEFFVFYSKTIYSCYKLRCLLLNKAAAVADA